MGMGYTTQPKKSIGVDLRMKALRMKNRLPFVKYFSRAVLVAVLATAAVLTLFAGSSTKSSNQIDQVLREAVDQKNLPGVVAMVADADGVIYQGASGKRDTAKNVPMTVDSIFRIASMTKPITSVAVMQLVESGRLKLDEPVATYLPELSQVQVLEEFDASTGKAKLRPPKAPPTVRQLLSHTSGFAYEFFDPQLHAYVATGAVPSARQGDDGFLKAPLLFDPGSRWEYGISTDWLGKLVEKVSGQNARGLLPPTHFRAARHDGYLFRCSRGKGVASGDYSPAQAGWQPDGIAARACEAPTISQ